VEVSVTLAGTTSTQRKLRSARSIRNPSTGVLTATVSPMLPAPPQSLFEIAAFLSSTSPSCCRGRPVDQDCEESVIHERASVVSATGQAKRERNAQKDTRFTGDERSELARQPWTSFPGARRRQGAHDVICGAAPLTQQEQQQQQPQEEACLSSSGAYLPSRQPETRPSQDPFKTVPHVGLCEEPDSPTLG
jgi:hypothetical protein